MNLQDLRRKIDRLNTQIVGRFRDRAYFPQNLAVYQPGAIDIAGKRGSSLLEFALAGLEFYHASLGRYSYPDQLPIRDDTQRESPVQRIVVMPALPTVELSVRDELMRFYLGLIPELCAPGDDPQFYGETAYADADLLVRLHERINLGRFVAKIKIEREPALAALIDQPEELRERLADRQREQEVLDVAMDTATRYGLDPNLIASVFRWMVDETLLLEVRFLQRVQQR